MNKIARFESLAEWLVEGTFARLFADRLSPLEVVRHLARAMEDNQTFSPVGIPQAPTHYWVRLNPGDVKALDPDPNLAAQGMSDSVRSLESELAIHVAELANQTGLALRYKPTVRVTLDEDVASHDVHVEARWMPEEADEVESTSRMAEVKVGDKDGEDEGSKKEVDELSARRPFLILQGERHINLHQPIVSIGRALDNDIILEDPRVSRHHAQLRRRGTGPDDHRQAGRGDGRRDIAHLPAGRGLALRHPARAAARRAHRGACAPLGLIRREIV